MTNSLMNTGISGLNAAQNMLNVVSNNISNAHTSGYNRQQLVLSQPKTGQSGVNVSAVNRVFNRFMVDQLRQAQSQSGAVNAYYNQLSKLDNILGHNDESGISAQINNLFENLNKLSANASDQAARQTVISNCESLVNQFNNVERNLKNQIADVNTQLTNNVDTINTYTKQIAELNYKIAKLQNVNPNDTPNALLDQRDQLVNELSELVGITVNEQNGHYNITLTNGLSLVQGSTVSTLCAQPSPADPTLNVIIYNHSSGARQELNSQSISSGTLHGLLTFRDGPLTDARNQLGLVALNLAERFNEVHVSGVDINGNVGEKLFAYQTPSGIAHINNQGNATVNVHYATVSEIKASDYRIEFNGQDWIVTRLSDHSNISAQYKDGQLMFDGLVINVIGDPANGDSFIIKPVADIAASLQLLVKDPNKLATGIADDDHGVADNRNLTQLLGIQNEKLINGNTTLNGAYASLVSYIGSETKSAKASVETNNHITDQINEQNQSISGVNIEEEYVSMQVYLQYYQANAKVIDTATTLFDTILGLTK